MSRLSFPVAHQSGDVFQRFHCEALRPWYASFFLAHLVGSCRDAARNQEIEKYVKSVGRCHFKID
jgi:hypothetical protein